MNDLKQKAQEFCEAEGYNTFLVGFLTKFAHSLIDQKFMVETEKYYHDIYILNSLVLHDIASPQTKELLKELNIKPEQSTVSSSGKEESDKNIEVWKDIQGYEGIYQISSSFRVRSLDRTIQSKRGNGFDMEMKGRLIRPTYGKNIDHLKVNLSKDGETETLSVYSIYNRHFKSSPASTEQPKDTPQLGVWISLKDRLPDNRTYVIINNYSGTDIAEYKHGCFFINLDRVMEVTHWMPLPLAPGESKLSTPSKEVSEEDIEDRFNLVYPNWRGDSEFSSKVSAARSMLKWYRDQIKDKP